MAAYVIFALLLVLFSLFKFLNVSAPPTPPRLVTSDKHFLASILKYCSHLNERYVPVRLWGSSGHMQTIIHATVGYTFCQKAKAKRCAARQDDGATVIWDLYEPTVSSQFKESITIAICPGIANSSESAYVQSLVSLASENGFTCIVLNHLGSLAHVTLTSPRLFRYGKTDEFHLMLKKFLECFPRSKLVLVGFSMGANIVCKYLGEQRPRSPNIIAGISVGQGYDAVRTLHYLLQWHNLARLYLYSLTENMRSVIIRNKEALFTEEVKRKLAIDERRVLSAATLLELDDVYTKLIFGFRTTEELYKADSCANYLHNVSVPLVLINARDDPVISPELLTIPEKFAMTLKNCLYIETDHGGHLGFYEGGLIYPKPITWLDRTVVGLVIALASREL